MGDDITKISTFDDRIVQQETQYAIVKGANSINSMPFQAQTESSAQHQYTIQVPNQGVYMDRALLWTSTCYLKVNVVVGGSPVQAIRLGREVSLNSFPLHRLINVINGTINNQNVTFNCDILNEVLALVDDPTNKEVRTCATSQEYFARKGDEAVAGMSSIGAAETVTTRENRTNGAYPHIWFTDNTGAIPTVFPAAIGGGVQINADGSLTLATGLPFAPGAGVEFYVKFTSTEKFLLSPLVFSEMCERDTGIFGLNNVMLTLNMTQPSFTSQIGRVLALAPTLVGGSPNSISYLATKAFEGSQVNVQFLDPNWEMPLPNRSMVPYMDYSRYIDQPNVTIPAYNAGSPYATTEIRSQTITLPYIPDMILLSVRPLEYDNGAQGSYTFPITKISLQWANRSGLLSSHTPEQLYSMSQANGLKQTYEEWSGIATSNRVTDNYGKVPLTGGMLVLRPGIDFVLEPGQAPGMVGNFVIQATIGVRNQFPNPFPNTRKVRVCLLAVNSGFFATVFGASTLMRGILDPSDIIKKGPVALTEQTLQRAIGGSWYSGAKRFFSNALSGKYNRAANAGLQFGKELYDLYKGNGQTGYSGGAYSGGMTDQPMSGKRARLLGERAM